MIERTIDLKDIGPIVHTSIPVPEEGGVVVLRGPNGSGKTKAIEAVNSLVTGKGRLDARDGALRGEISGFGARITVSRSTRRKGELEVETLEGRLNVADLVDPHMKSDDAADAKRIKALVSLSQVDADPSLFYELVDGRKNFEAVVGASSIEGDDLVLMASRIKRDLEQGARTKEGEAEHAQGTARGHTEAAEGVDLDVETDRTKLDAELERAIQESQRLASESKAAEAAAGNAAEARTALAALPEAKPVASLRDKADEAKRERQVSEERLGDLLRQVELAKRDVSRAKDREAAAEEILEAAVREDELRQKWADQVDASEDVSCPSDREIELARKQVEQCREAIEAATLARQARTHLEQAKDAENRAALCVRAAERLRAAAAGTDEVLSEVVSRLGCPLRIEAGRLVIDTPTRGATYYSELSQGERWRLALDLAIEQVGEKGIITIPQEAWEGLDPPNRAAIVEHVKGRHVVILTAQSDDGEFGVEVL